jgi:hypothetical protein
MSNLNLNVLDGSTLAATEIYGADKKTYINIGSGNVFKLSWNTPILTNDSVAYYKLIIKRHDTVSNIYYDIFDKNIGLVNEFYVDSVLLPSLPLQYKLSVYVVAYGKLGNIVTSNVVTPYVSKSTGTYTKVQPEGYQQPIMKRALALVNVPPNDSTYKSLLDSNGTELLDNNGKLLVAEASTVLANDTWNIMLEGYTRTTSGTWQPSDIKYEVLVDETGEIITDTSNNPIYVL